MVVQRGSLSRIRLCDFSPGPLARHVRRTGPLSWRAFLSFMPFADMANGNSISPVYQ